MNSNNISDKKPLQINSRCVPVNLSDEIIEIKQFRSTLKDTNSPRDFSFLKKYVNSLDFHTRRLCLNIYKQYGTPMTYLSEMQLTIFQLVSLYTDDSHGEVRMLSYLIFEKWLEDYNDFDWDEKINNLFEIIKHGFTDDYDESLIACMNFAVNLANKFPDYKISIDDFGEPERFVDCIFRLVAAHLGHHSTCVRYNSVKLLGNLFDVKEQYLLESLEKVVMTNSKVKVSVLQRKITENNKRSADDIFKLHDVVVGAIVFGTEDEFYEVRRATIRTICKISEYNMNFAGACQSLLINLLTDDMENIRYTAIIGLRENCQRSNKPFYQDELDIIGGLLSEVSSIIRRSVFDLLSTCQVATNSALIRLVDLALIQSYKCYPMDLPLIWNCAARVGYNHPEFVFSRRNQLLNLHPYLTTTQPSTQDPNFITILLMIINAAKFIPNITHGLPKYLINAFHYIRDKVPQLVPKESIDQINNDSICSMASDTKRSMVLDDNTQRESHLNRLIDDVRSVITYRLLCKSYYSCVTCEKYRKEYTSEYNTCYDDDNCRDDATKYYHQILQSLNDDLKQLRSSLDWGFVDFLDNLIRLVALLAYINCSKNPNDANIHNKIKKSHFNVLRLIYAYSNIPTNDMDILRKLSKEISNKVDEIEETNNKMEFCSNEIHHTICLGQLLSLQTLQCDTDILSRPALVKAKMIYPENNEDGLPSKFIGGLAAVINIRAEFTNLEVNNAKDNSFQVLTPIVVMLRSPDGRVIEWHPPKSSWTRCNKSLCTLDEEGVVSDKNCLPSSTSNDNNTFYYLDTEIMYSSSEWSKKSKVKITCGILLHGFHDRIFYPLMEDINVPLFFIPGNSCL